MMMVSSLIISGCDNQIMRESRTILQSSDPVPYNRNMLMGLVITVALRTPNLRTKSQN